ncbi:hypothetical protein CHELA40_11220 [Chelatococcus asaccharovorans]|nr:hypothetical protein CHELA40_11220 [Chelatococcus asaccharovorans]CAH1685201.1 hypothetical protein CHELA17_64381 [Chelatococcus asaccharovorans]
MTLGAAGGRGADAGSLLVSVAQLASKKALAKTPIERNATRRGVSRSAWACGDRPSATSARIFRFVTPHALIQSR